MLWTTGLPAADPVERTVEVDGRTRRYLLHVPDRPAPAAGWPVILAFHGGGGRPEGQARMTRLHDLGATEGFVTVYPAGSGRFERALLTWNGGNCCGYAMTQGVDDSGFVARLLDDLATRVPVDPDRIHATGMSNGGNLCYRLAIDLPDRIASIAPVGAPMVRDSPRRGARPVPVLHFHGTADASAPIEGGVGPKSRAGIAWPPVRTRLAGFARAWGLPETPRREPLVESADDGKTAHVEAWGPGANGAEIRLVVIEGGTHSWPGGPVFAARLLGAPARHVDANRLMWDFFRTHPR